MIRVKICCISSVDEARLAVAAGASALGFVSAMPSGAGVITEAAIATILPHVPPGVSTFLLTSETEAEAIISQQRRTGANTLQLTDAVDFSVYSKLRVALPGIKVVQVIHVRDEDSVLEAQSVSAWVDGLLLDSGNPTLAVKELGGTGQVHDWNLSRKICETCPVPVYLAGGLRAENARAAIRQVHPFALDLCTGVRTRGHLDPVRLARFMTVVREENALLHAESTVHE